MQLQVHVMSDLNWSGAQLLIGISSRMELARSLQRNHSPHSVHGPQHLTIKVNKMDKQKQLTCPGAMLQ